MLQATNQNVKYCYEQALVAEERAANARTSGDRTFFLDNAKKWFGLAASYEYQERLEAFLKEFRSSIKRPLCPTCNLPIRPNRLVQTSEGLFEFQFKCASCQTTRAASQLVR
jgi:hypothetical protein